VSLLAGAGQYNAAWVLCSDNVTDGVTYQTYTECQTTNGLLTSSSVFGGIGGTSASAPAFAGMLALVAQARGSAFDNYRLGQANYILYQLAQSKYSNVFHDVTTGNNSVPCTSGSPNCGSNGFLSGYNAGSKYDLASGLGSVDVAAMVNNWTSVALASTSTSLKISGLTAAYTGVHGQSLNFAVNVTPSSATGEVGIVDNANENANQVSGGAQNNGQFAIPITGGAGAATYNGLPGGSYAVWARYSGDTANASSTSTPPISVTITPEASTTTLTINAYNPSTGTAIPTSNVPYGSYVFADAVITGTAEGSKTQGVATGTVQFLNNGQALGSEAVSSSGNLASWPPYNSSFAALSAGNYNLTAQYSGDASYLPSTATASFTITKAPTTTVAGTVVNPPLPYATQVQIAVDVLTNSFGVAPTGTFQFYVDGQPVLAPQPVYESGGYNNANGKNNWAWADAQTLYAFMSVGQHTLSASYSGDTNYTSSMSPAVNVTVAQAMPTFTTIGWGIPSLTATIGQQTTATATLAGSGGAVPTGTITFYNNGNAIAGTVTYTGLQNGVTASIPYTFTSAGKQVLTASYSGDANYLATTSPISNTVTVLGPFSVTAGAITVTAPGQSGSTGVTVTPNGTFTGTVTLSCTVPSSAAETTCGFGSGSNITSTVQLTITGSAGATANLNVTTTAQHQLAALPGWRSSGLVLAVLFVVIAPMRRWNRKLRLMALAVVLILSQASCGGSGGGGGGGGGKTDPGTLPGTYSFTVSAASGSGANAYSTSTQVSALVQ
jgi:hypothetical protein